jgi:hypothetical protein
VIDNVQDKVWAVELCKAKRLHQEEVAQCKVGARCMAEEKRKAEEAEAVEQRLDQG